MGPLQPFVDAGWTVAGGTATLTNARNIKASASCITDFGITVISLKVDKNGKGLKTVRLAFKPERLAEIAEWLASKVPTLKNTTDFDWLLEISVTNVGVSVSTRNDRYELPRAIPDPATSGEVPADLPDGSAWQALFIRRGWQPGSSGVDVELTPKNCCGRR